jgi:hypothetical protein
MHKRETHFEQVPLEVVRTVIEEQIWREAKIEQKQRPREEVIVKKIVVVAEQIQGGLRQILPSGSEQGSI